ncbi:hypothetical protein [Ferruginibacter sp. HRS2-29]|uniref:hypothetical protein n=1 Tax=Ferruginibacter sp. HRS2-29 TaxID=2487334 RepID=UPI0020CDA86B|nr:hypothetical protein [Ferruginibacter sp. HRS2-29]MCP9749657.1 hypothetical protein [Ferruginibacter sp. HRS2-29]
MSNHQQYTTPDNNDHAVPQKPAANTHDPENGGVGNPLHSTQATNGGDINKPGSIDPAVLNSVKGSDAATPGTSITHPLPGAGEDTDE